MQEVPFSPQIWEDTPMRLLRVEDDPRIARFMAKGFQEQSYAEDVVSHGHDAVYEVEINDYRGSSEPSNRHRVFRRVTRVGTFVPFLLRTLAPLAMLRILIPLLAFLFAATSAYAQGGPPYYTNDPGTPGNLNWEINLGYMPFFYSNQSVSHTPDVDINFGVGDRIQLTYESAWLRVQNPFSTTKFGLGQSNPGVKWRFYDAGESGLSISVFPQLFLNNPNDAVRRGITPASDTFLLPLNSPESSALSTWTTKSVISLSIKDQTVGSPASSSATNSLQNSKLIWSSILKEPSTPPTANPPWAWGLATKSIVR